MKILGGMWNIDSIKCLIKGRKQKASTSGWNVYGGIPTLLTMTEINRQVNRLALTSPNVDVCRPNAWVPTNNALFFPVFCIQHVQRNARPQISKLHMGIIESVRELCKIGKWPLQYFLCPSQQAVLTSFIRGQCGAQSNVTKCYHSVSHTIRWRDPLM